MKKLTSLRTLTLARHTVRVLSETKLGIGGAKENDGPMLPPTVDGPNDLCLTGTLPQPSYGYPCTVG